MEKSTECGFFRFDVCDAEGRDAIRRGAWWLLD